MKIDYNAPVVLTFTLICLAVLLIDSVVPIKFTDNFFTVYGTFNAASPLDYLRLVTHSMGHSGFQHFLNNSLLLLLLGPILEERYGSLKLLAVMFFTSIVTAVFNIIMSDTGVRGASGIVFAFIILASIVNVKKGTLPLTFILIFIIYIGGEITSLFKADNVSQSAHIVGGIVGAVFGFIVNNRKLDKESSAKQ